MPALRMVELLTVTQAFELKPGMPPKETMPANWFVVGRMDVPDSLKLVIRPSEPMAGLTVVEMGTPRWDWKFHKVDVWRISSGSNWAKPVAVRHATPARMPKIASRLRRSRRFTAPINSEPGIS